MSKPEQNPNSDQPSLDQQLQKYKSQNHNILLPTDQMLEVSEMFRPSLETVQLKLDFEDPARGDAYPLENANDPEKCDKWALSKKGLLRLMNCAGIVIDPVNSKLLPGMTRDYCAYQVVGALKKADGSWFPMIGTAEIDMLA